MILPLGFVCQKIDKQWNPSCSMGARLDMGLYMYRVGKKNRLIESDGVCERDQ